MPTLTDYQYRLAAATPQALVGADPAVGAEYSIAVPAGQQWLLYAIRIQLVTSAVVAQRRPSLVLDDGANVYLRIPANQQQAENTTVDFGWAVGLGSNITNLANFVYSPLPSPPLPMPAGHRIRTITSLLDVGDNYGPPTLFYQAVLL